MSKDSRITSSILYQFFILGILIKLGGSAETSTVINRIRQNYGDKFFEKDLMDYEKSKEIRWKNYVRFARQHLIEAGYLKRGSARSIWEIADEGRKKYKEWFELIQKNLPQSKGSI